ncbi:hypothetical protein CLIB1444_04S07228 [[Candida] jaroonii]|uniref:Uncharacterized protein n=1 Tax=[Candida] jaroonii TaxID=467808 RepID=A0ACA9Y7R3_9ASCO|nr:hypothetical protein CLIB1444_04S07228 [[Candida] jaroonii]
MYIIPEFNNQPNGNIKIESYNGRIKSLKDALLILEGTRLGILPKVKRRLNGLEREFIDNGKIFAWNETECGMKRWTDGKNWSASKVNGPFLIYKELDSDKLTIKANGLIKQSFSLTTKQGEKFHLIGYFKEDEEVGKIPSNDGMLKGLKLNDNVYQEYLLYYDQYLSDPQGQGQGMGQGVGQGIPVSMSMGQPMGQAMGQVPMGQAMGQVPMNQVPINQVPLQTMTMPMGQLPMGQLPMNMPINQVQNIIPGYQSHLSLSTQSLPSTYSNQSSFSSSSSFSGPAVHANSVNSSISSASTGYYPIYRNPDSPPQTVSNPSYPDNLSTLANLSQDHRYYVQSYPYYTYSSSATSPTQTHQPNPQAVAQSVPPTVPPTIPNSVLTSYSGQFQSSVHPTVSVANPQTSQSQTPTSHHSTSHQSTSPQPITNKIYSLNNGSSMSISPGNRDDHQTLKILDRGFSNQS